MCYVWRNCCLTLFHSFPTVAPAKVTIKGPKEARAGDNVTMVCKTGRSNPPAEISWVVDGRPMNAHNNVTPDAAGGFVTTADITVSITNQVSHLFPLRVMGTFSPKLAHHFQWLTNEWKQKPSVNVCYWATEPNTFSCYFFHNPTLLLLPSIAIALSLQNCLESHIKKISLSFHSFTSPTRIATASGSSLLPISHRFTFSLHSLPSRIGIWKCFPVTLWIRLWGKQLLRHPF